MIDPSSLILVTAIKTNALFGLSQIEPREAECLAHNIHYEAMGASISGKIAVGAATITRTKMDGFPTNVCGVVAQKIKNVCQFEWRCKKKKLKLNLKSSPQWAINDYKLSTEIAVGLLAGFLEDNTDGATFFVNPQKYRPIWAKKMTKTLAIDGHVFYKQPMRACSKCASKI